MTQPAKPLRCPMHPRVQCHRVSAHSTRHFIGCGSVGCDLYFSSDSVESGLVRWNNLVRQLRAWKKGNK